MEWKNGVDYETYVQNWKMFCRLALHYYPCLYDIKNHIAKAKRALQLSVVARSGQCGKAHRKTTASVS